MSEDQITEWKETLKDDFLKVLCGFANAEGGTLVIGIDDSGTPVGVKNAPKLLEDLPNKVRDVLGIMVGARLRRLQGCECVEIRVEPYPGPVSCRGEYFVRSGSTTQQIKGTALDRFLMSRYGRTWDSFPMPGPTPRDLSPSAFETFRRLAGQSRRMEPAKLKGPHSSKPFNPALANAFFRAGSIEAWGRGIQRIYSACKDAATPEPQIATDASSEFSIEFPFSSEYLAAVSSEPSNPIRPTGEKTREKILDLIRQNPAITTPELAHSLGITPKGIEWQIRQLKSSGHLQRIGSAKGGRWQVLQPS